MPPPDPPAAAPVPAEPAAAPRWWTRCGWAAAHLLLAYHLVSLAISPATLDPASATQRGLYGASEPYLNALHLNHGYHYFAPEPGPSTLLEYDGTRPDGTRVAGVIPDAAGHFPRLLYHRHFMLTERLPAMASAPPEIRRRYHAALARGLGLQTGAEELSLTVLTHRLPDVREVRAGFGLHDPATYAERPLGRFDARPAPPTGAVP